LKTCRFLFVQANDRVQELESGGSGKLGKNERIHLLLLFFGLF